MNGGINRRMVLKTAAVAGMALMIPRPGRAEEAEPQIVITSEIQFNHGHEVRLTAVEVIRLLRATAGTSEPAVLDIQGASGHPHALEFSHAEIQNLLISGVLEKASTQVAGHSHGVLIRLDLI